MGMRIAVVGSGIAGLAAAYQLRDHAEVTLFEAGDYFGGHTHTVDVSLPAGPKGETVTHGVDTGFLVFNERTYPQLIALFAELGIATAPSDMSFSVQSRSGADALEWSGSNLNTVFAQRSNLVRPRFWGMLSDLLRFNALTTRMALEGSAESLQQPLGEFLDQHRFGQAFREAYFLPMMACIWSCPTRQMLEFPVSTMVRFCHNHGLLQISGRPQWHTVRGGARHYVDAILQGIPHKHLRSPVHRVQTLADGRVSLHLDTGEAVFDKVVLACHSDQALALLDQPTAEEQRLLGAIRYQPNTAVLHTDVHQLPRRKAAWAAWNYERGAADSSGDAGDDAPSVCLHYLLNRLQPLPWETPVIVSLNPLRPIDPRHALGRFDYAHPVFDLPAVAAQAQMDTIQGAQGRYFCGAWMGYGFHEDGLKAGRHAAQRLLADLGRAAQPAAPMEAVA